MSLTFPLLVCPPVVVVEVAFPISTHELRRLSREESVGRINYGGRWPGEQTQARTVEHARKFVVHNREAAAAAAVVGKVLKNPKKV